MKRLPLPNRKFRHFRFLILCLMITIFTSVQVVMAAYAATTTFYNKEYTTAENGKIGFRYNAEPSYSSGYFDIIGKNGNDWIETTYRPQGTYNSPDGYITYLKIGNTCSLVKASDSGYTPDGTNLNVKIEALFPNEETIQVRYTVTNTGNTERTFSLGTGSKLQLNQRRKPSISLLDENRGFKAVAGELQFTFFGTGYEGVTDVSGFWFGDHAQTSMNWYETEAKSKLFNETAISASPQNDAAISWHWANQTISAGESVEYSVIIAITAEDDTTSFPPLASSVPPSSPDTGNDTLPIDPVNSAVLPKTGDATPIILCIALAACSGCTLMVLRRKAKKAA